MKKGESMRKRIFLCSIFLTTLLCAEPMVEINTTVEIIKKIEEQLENPQTKYVISVLKNLWDVVAFPLLQKKIIDDIVQYNPDKYRIATIKNGSKILKQGYSLEGNYLTKRFDKAKKTLEKFINESIPATTMPRIACAFSGGGYRAMILTAGYMKALEDIDLLDSIIYISTLSGSTWFLNPWILQQKPQKNSTVNEYIGSLSQKIKNDTFDPFSTTNAKNFSVKKLAADILWPKLAFSQIISSVDLYGSILAYTLFSEFGEARQQQKLSNQWFNIQQGNAPWPIYTAISGYKVDEGSFEYHWYEFNPEEVRNITLNCAVPAYSFGRKFQYGISQDFAPEQSLGFLLGFFGSAYTVNLYDLEKKGFFGSISKDNNPQEAQKALETLQNHVLKEEYVKALAFLILKPKNIELVQQGLYQKVVEMLGGKRMIPAQVFNPFKDYTVGSEWLQNKDFLTFVDAAIDCNIPLLPLFNPERKIDIIFIGDASGSTQPESELKKALAQVQKIYEINYVKDQALSDAMLSVWRPDSDHESAPILIYGSFIEDQALIKKYSQNSSLQQIIKQYNLVSYKAGACLADFCKTFNFSYNLSQFDQIRGIAELNFKAHKDIIKNVIKDRVAYEEHVFGG